MKTHSCLEPFKSLTPFWKKNEAYFQNMSYTCMVNVKECYGENICVYDEHPIAGRDIQCRALYSRSRYLNQLSNPQLYLCNQLDEIWYDCVSSIKSIAWNIISVANLKFPIIMVAENYCSSPYHARLHCTALYFFQKRFIEIFWGCWIVGLVHDKIPGQIKNFIPSTELLVDHLIFL